MEMLLKKDGSGLIPPKTTSTRRKSVTRNQISTPRISVMKFPKFYATKAPFLFTSYSFVKSVKGSLSSEQELKKKNIIDEYKSLFFM